MADTCRFCGGILAAPDATCPTCARLSLDDGAITANPPMPGGAYSEEAPEPRSILRQDSAPACPAWLIIGASGVLFFFLGFASVARPFEAAEDVFIWIGAGTIIGTGIAVDHWFFKKKLRMVLATDPERSEEYPSVIPPPSDWISGVMLVLPVLLGGVWWFSKELYLTSWQVNFASIAVVVATSVLGYFSMRQMVLYLGHRLPVTGAFRDPVFTYLAMLFFWIIFYPIHFIMRWRMGGRNLIVPGFVATLAYCAPMVKSYVILPELPPADHPEVLALVKQIVEDQGIGQIAIRGPFEARMDAKHQQIVCHCTLATGRGNEKLTYAITWQDRAKDIYQVQVFLNQH